MICFCEHTSVLPEHTLLSCFELLETFRALLGDFFTSCAALFSVVAAFTDLVVPIDVILGSYHHYCTEQ